MNKKPKQIKFNFKEARLAIADAYRSTKSFKETHASLIGKLTNIRANLTKSVTLQNKEYLRGYSDAKFEELQSGPYFEFCYYWNGTLYTTSKQDTGKPKLDYDNRELIDYVSSGKAPSGRYWIGTNKPF